MGLIRLVNSLFQLYELILLARIFTSWVNADPYNPVVRWLYRMTEPVMRPFRGLLPPLGMIDFSPVLVFLALEVARQLVVRFLWTVLL
ncbi:MULTISPECIES: YggT family protein [Limnochorda]|uniref:YggT family protein n=1 Tax=Limnochorda TaxID=1676651 RepID=UPI00184EBEC6|nr:YggT family protein [Limnochorda pilosa]MBO2486652.1 hypothetical protein [Bacillota bacterium]MBO2520053.1 hypothetical protein [Bacillota bacterium]NMA71361.1 YggT family protein [Bacillota bacterium]